jgi:hypothetical protein
LLNEYVPWEIENLLTYWRKRFGARAPGVDSGTCPQGIDGVVLPGLSRRMVDGCLSGVSKRRWLGTVIARARDVRVSSSVSPNPTRAYSRQRLLFAVRLLSCFDRDWINRDSVRAVECERELSVVTESRSRIDITSGSLEKSE